MSRRPAARSAVDVFERQKLGSAGQARGGCRSSAGFFVEPAIEHEEAVEAAHGATERATERGDEPAGHLLPHERFERVAIQRVDARRPVPAANAASARRSRA